MSKETITLSKKYGVNPSMVICPVCKKEQSIALFGRLKGDAEAPRTIPGELCDDCKDKYIQIIEVESEQNRIGTGRYVFVPKDALNVECPEGKAIMAKEEFSKMFKDG